MHNAILVAPNKILVDCTINQDGAGNAFVTNPFTEQPQLVDRPIIAIEMFSASDMAISPISQLPVLPDAIFIAGFLNIMRSGDNISGSEKAGIWFKNIPLSAMRNVYNINATVSGCLDKFRCDPMTIQWRDTNISFPSGTQIAQPYAAPMLITYLLKDQDTIPYRRAFKKGMLPHGLHNH